MHPLFEVILLIYISINRSISSYTPYYIYESITIPYIYNGPLLYRILWHITGALLWCNNYSTLHHVNLDFYVFYLVCETLKWQNK